MTALVTVAERLDNALVALEPLITSARLNEDAAYARLQFGRAQQELTAAKRLVGSLIDGMTRAERRQLPAAITERTGRIVIDGAPGIGTTEQGARVLVTFDRATRIPASAWPPAQAADSEGGEA